MRYLLFMSVLVGLASCSDMDLKSENQELLEITKDMTATIEDLKLEVEKQQQLALDAAAAARMAEADAMEQVAIRESKLEALKKRLKDCQ